MPGQLSPEYTIPNTKSRSKQVSGQAASDSPKRSWISEVTGSFKDDSEFDKILRLGKEIRDADRPEDED
jgi:hypothetical protein